MIPIIHNTHNISIPFLLPTHMDTYVIYCSVFNPAGMYEKEEKRNDDTARTKRRTTYDAAAAAAAAAAAE